MRKKKIEIIVKDGATERWIRETMKKFMTDPCIRKKAILSSLFKEVIYSDGKLACRVNLDPENASDVSEARKKGEKKLFRNYIIQMEYIISE